MILVLTQSVDLGRYVEVMKLASRKGAWSEKVQRIDWPTCDLSKLGPEETLYISAHGDDAKVESMDPEALAKLLVSKGLTSVVNFKKLKVMSCASGITSGSGTPYCQRLANELAGNGGPAGVTVVGFDGATTVCSEHGKLQAKDTPLSGYPNYTDWKQNHEPTYLKWNQSAKSMACNDEKQFQQNAETLWQTPGVQQAFAWLYKSNVSFTKSSAEGKTFAASNKTTHWKK